MRRWIKYGRPTAKCLIFSLMLHCIVYGAYILVKTQCVVPWMLTQLLLNCFMLGFMLGAELMAYLTRRRVAHAEETILRIARDARELLRYHGPNG